MNKNIRFCISEPFMVHCKQISELHKNFYQQGLLLYSGRNTIKKMTIEQAGEEPIEIVVKSFEIPSPIQGFLKANFMQSKARNSIINAERLLDKGILTPDPIASIEQLKLSCIRRSYYICKYWYNNYDLGALLYRGEAQELNTQTLLENLVRFTVQQHDNGILHLDYNPGNILVRAQENRLKFALVDLIDLGLEN